MAYQSHQVYIKDKITMWLKSIVTLIESGWNKFESWVARITSGFKTRLATALGALGSVGAMGQEYVSQMPLTKFITAEQVAAASLVLFTLAFWFRGLGDRVQTRDILSAPKALDNP